MRKILNALLVASLALVSCAKDEPDKTDPDPHDPIVIPETSMPPVFSDEGGSASFGFTANTAWRSDVTATRAVDWCSVSPVSGGPGEVTLLIETRPNESPEERNASIVLKAGTVSRTFMVTQKQKDALTVSSSKIELGEEGGMFGIEVKANVDFEVELGDDCKGWITQNATRSLRTTYLPFTAETNDDTVGREGTITIRSSEGSEIVKVYQAGSAPVLVLTQKEYTVASAGETIRVEIKSNVNYSVVMPHEDWIRESTTRALSTHTRYFEIAPNQTCDNRSAEIVFKDDASGLTQKVIVTQLRRDALVVAQNSYAISDEGGEISVTVNHNVEFDIEIDKEWVTLVGTRSLSTDVLKFAVAAHTGYDNREALIAFTSKDKTIRQEVRIYQAQKNAIVVSRKEYAVSDAGGEIEIEVRANVDFSVEGPGVEWMHEVETRALTGHTLRYEIDPNGQYEPRTATLEITNRDNGLSETVTVFQMQKGAIVVAKESYTVPNEGGEITVEVTHNIDFDTTVSVDWIRSIETRGMMTDYLNFAVAGNSSADDREGKIVFTSKDKTKRQEVRVRQTQKNTLILSRHEYDLPDTGGSVTVEVNTNVNFTVEITKGAEWLHRVTTRGMVVHTLLFEADANTTPDSREASIRIVNAADGMEETVIVRQSQKDAIIIGANRYEVPQAGGRLDIPVKSNIDYTVAITSGADWITRIEGTRALTESTVSLAIAENPSEKPRTGKVTVGDAASKTESVVTIVQAAKKEEHCLELVYNVLSTTGYTCLYSQLEPDPLRGEFSNSCTVTRTVYDDEEIIGYNSFKWEYKFNRTGDIPVRVYYEGTLTTIYGFDMNDYDNCRLKSIDIPETVNSIYFEKMYALTSVTIRNATLQNVPKFKECPCLEALYGPSASSDNRCLIRNGELLAFASAGLSEYTIPDGVTTIADGVFDGCKTLMNITFPESLTSIGSHAFSRTNISQFKFPESLTSIGSNAFSQTKISHIALPESLESLGDSAFSGCELLKEVIIPNKCTDIGRRCFRYCTSLTGIVLPEGIPEIPDGMFSDCPNLSGIILPSTVTVIGRDAFYACTALKSVTLPDNLTTIGVTAFKGSGLETIRLGRNIRSIGYSAFDYCKSLCTVEFDPDCQISIIEEYTFSGTPITAVTVPKNVETIENGVFRFCQQLETVKFAQGSKLKRINDGGVDRTFLDMNYGVFAYCSSLSDIRLPESLEYIGVGAFVDCINLQSIEIPSSVTSIGKAAFYECENLKTIDLPDALTSIGSHAFFDCRSLERITIGSGMQSIAFTAFYKCISLKSFTSKSAFYETSSDSRCLVDGVGQLTAFAPAGVAANYTVPSSTRSFVVKRIAPRTFGLCDINTVTVPETVTEIGAFAFANDKIKTVYCKAVTPPALQLYDEEIRGSDWKTGPNYGPLPVQCTIYVPMSSVEAYREAWKEYDLPRRIIIGYNYGSK